MTPVRALRDLLSVILLVGALLVGALWLPAAWLQHNVVDREGFLAITEPLGEDPAFQRTFTDGAVDHLMEDERVPGWLAEQATPYVQEQAADASGSDAYAQMWRETMGELHDALFAPGSSPLQVDLSPAVDGLIGSLEGHLPFDLPRTDGEISFTLATVPDLPLVHRLGVLDPWGDRLGPIAGAMALLAVLIAGHRRTMIALAGGAAVLAGVAGWMLADRIEEIVPDSLDQADFLGPIVQVLEQRFQADVGPQAIVLMGAGALVAALGLILMGVHRRPQR